MPMGSAYITTVEKIANLAITISELSSENKQLKERVKYLEDQNKMLMDNLMRPVSPPAQVKPYTGCSVCGLNFNGPMGYVCPRSDCPTRITCKGTTL